MSQYEFPPFEPFLVGESSSQSNPGSQMKRTRSSSKIVRREKKKTPKAVITRGLPSGYYEIPVKIYTKIYYSQDKGFFITDQTTGAPNGTQFGAGIGFYTALDTQYWNIGGFGVYNQIAQTIPNFASLQTVFDSVKIASIKHDFWFTTTVASPAVPGYGEPSTFKLLSSGLDAAEVWVVNDRNNANPGQSVDDICQYSNVKYLRSDNRRHTIKYTPYIRTSIGTTGEESGTTDTLSQNTPATYCQTAKPAAAHMGLRGIFMTSSVNNVPVQGFLHIMTTQLRRYKMVN